MSTVKRRVYLDLDEDVAELIRDKAYNLRISMKRYVEALIEKDCKSKEDKKLKPKGK